VTDGKGLTIASQKRYVKFLEGFLNIHLWQQGDTKNIEYPKAQYDAQGAKPAPENDLQNSVSWFELYLKRYNKLIENMVFNDMAKK
jgi:hypothetical protein